MVLCPVRRPVTTLDCVPSKDKSLVFAAGLGPEISCGDSQYYKDLATLPNAGYPPSVLSSYVLPVDPQGRIRSNNF
jgi:hypothetical protein